MWLVSFRNFGWRPLQAASQTRGFANNINGFMAGCLRDRTLRHYLVHVPDFDG
jgi:hypothetical protein